MWELLVLSQSREGSLEDTKERQEEEERDREEC